MTHMAIEPCPYCGSDNVSVKARDLSWVKCHRCEAEGPCENELHLAVAQWNHVAQIVREHKERAKP